MDNGTNDMIYNYNATVRRPSTLVSIKGWGLFYSKLRGVKALPIAKVPGSTRLLSKLANEIKKDLTGMNSCGVLFLLAQN